MVKLLIFIILFGCLTSPESFANSSTDFDKDLLEHKIKFIIPTGWTKHIQHLETGPVYSYFPDKKSYMVITLSKNVTNERYEKDRNEYIKSYKSIPAVNLFNVKCDAFITERKQDNEIWKSKIIYCFKDEKVYLILLGAEKNQFDCHLPIFRDALQNLKLSE